MSKAKKMGYFKPYTPNNKTRLVWQPKRKGKRNERN